MTIKKAKESNLFGGYSVVHCQKQVGMYVKISFNKNVIIIYRDTWKIGHEGRWTRVIILFFSGGVQND